MKKNILIIEDDKASNELYNFSLKDKYNIFSIQSTENVYEIIEKNNIDLIILDIKILPIDGFDIAKKVKKNFQNIKIIAQTAQYQINNKENFDIFLQKPVPVKLLKDTVNFLLK